jgi:spore coat polysaccharide biosynthesis protein SpsF
MRTVAVIQARMGSTRLPGKVLMDIAGRPALALMVERLERADTLTESIVATSTLEQDDPIVRLCESLSVRVFRGSETDVLSRYVGAAQAFEADVIVRLTADCPFICPEVTDRIVRAFYDAVPPVHYATNCIRRTYPRGLDTEVISRRTLEAVAAEANAPADLEHVTYFVRRQPSRFRHLSVEDEDDRSGLRWTLDTPKDFQLLSRMSQALGARVVGSSYHELLGLFDNHPDWAAINADVEQTKLSGIS